jgi:AraC family ethanolamine operon transcriptional activator
LVELHANKKCFELYVVKIVHNQTKVICTFRKTGEDKMGRQASFAENDIEYVRRGDFCADDPAFYEAQSLPWEIMATPLDSHSFGHWKQYLVTPSVIVYQEGFTSTLRLRGLSPADRLGLCLPLRLGRKTRYWNAPPRSDGVPATMPGGVEAVFDSGQVHLMLLLDLELLHRSLPPDLALRLVDAGKDRFVPMARTAVNSLTSWLCGVLDETARHPEALAYSAAVRAFEDELLDRLARTVQLEGLSRTRPNVSLRRQGLDRALDFLRAADAASTISVPDLCAAAGTSQRTLEYAFRETFGITPLNFIRLRRFHMTRHELLVTRPGETTVGDIAYRTGFLEPGRFATSYRQLFGESPSQTLRRERSNELAAKQPLMW